MAYSTTDIYILKPSGFANSFIFFDVENSKAIIYDSSKKIL